MSHRQHPIARMVADYHQAMSVEESAHRLGRLLRLAEALLDDPAGPRMRYAGWAHSLDVDLRVGRVLIEVSKLMPLEQEWLLPLVDYEQNNSTTTLVFELPRITPELVGYLLDPAQPAQVVELAQRYFIPEMEAA